MQIGSHPLGWLFSYVDILTRPIQIYVNNLAQWATHAFRVRQICPSK